MKSIRQKRSNGTTVKNVKFNKKKMVSNQFKVKKTRISEEFKINDEEEEENRAEFEFLSKVYVPNYIIKNNKVLVSDLIPYLPNLIGNDEENEFTDINLELHLFLSSIMVNYINSWYLTKLNTDNFDFCTEIYQLLIIFTKDLCTRIGGLISNYDDLLDLLDKVFMILNDHLVDLVKESNDKYDLKIINDYFCRLNQQNLPDQQNYEIIGNYLSSKHIIFLNNRLFYFRLLIKEILDLIFKEKQLLNSQIESSLFISLLSDLVLNKIFEKLSSPQFILENINKIVVIANQKLLNSNKNETSSIWKKIGKFYSTIKSLVNFTWPTYKLNSDILNHHFFRVLNTLTNFTTRAPYLSSVILLLTNTVRQNQFLNTKLNSIAVQSIKLIYKSPLISSSQICNQISRLRREIFHKQDDEDEVIDEKLTIPVLVDNIHLTKVLLWQDLPVGRNFLNFDNESEHEFKTRLHSIIRIFNFQENDDQETINETCELNQLLIINLLDTIIHQLYPEI